MAAPRSEVTEKPKSPLWPLALIMLETPPPVLLVTEIVFLDHMSAIALPSANQLPPGGPAMNLSWGGQSFCGAGAAAAGAAATAAIVIRSISVASFFI